MTHSMETLLKETKDLRQQLRERETKIGSLETDLKKMNTYSVIRFEDTNSNSLARGTYTNDRPD